MPLSDNTCKFCWSNNWEPNGGDNTPTFIKGGHGGPLHVKCFMHIEKNPDEDKVKVYRLFNYLDSIDWVKTTEYKEEDIKKEIMENKGITQEMIDEHSKLKYDNNYINQFIDRCRDFPRESVKLKNTNTLEINSDRTYEAYAWIGAAEHNKDHGCKGVEKYNYTLVWPQHLIIFFKEYKQ